MVARWSHADNRYHVVGLELKHAAWLNQAAFCKQLAALKHLRFVKLHGASAAEVALWRSALPPGCEVEA